MRTLSLVLSVLLLAGAASAAEPAPGTTQQAIMTPPECVGQSGEILCGRLNKGDVRIISKFDRCRVVENATDKDFFVPMKTRMEMDAFFDHGEEAGLKMTACAD